MLTNLNASKSRGVNAGTGVVQEVIVHVAVFIDDPIVMFTGHQVVGDWLNVVRLTRN